MLWKCCVTKKRSNLSCLQLSVFLTSPQVSWVGSAGSCRFYVDLVHMFILLGPRLKEPWFPEGSFSHDGGQKCKRPNQNMHLAWIKSLCLDVTYIMSIYNPLVKASHMTKQNNNGMGSYLFPQYKKRSEWVFTQYSYIQINALSSVLHKLIWQHNTLLFFFLTSFSPNFKLLLFYKHNLR